MHLSEVRPCVADPDAGAAQDVYQVQEQNLAGEEVKPDDLYKLAKIPDEDIQSGRHSSAECVSHGCRTPVRYKMVIQEFPFDEENYNTDYFCEEHKP